MNNNNLVKEKKVFQRTTTIHFARYYSVLLLIVGWYIVYPVWDKGIFYLPSFIYGIFLKDWGMSLIFLSFPLYWIIISIIATQNNIKFLELKENSLSITLFGILKEKPLNLNYSEISSLEWSQDSFKHFVFNFKNGEQKLIRAEIYNKEKAFDLIQQKIKEFN